MSTGDAWFAAFMAILAVSIGWQLSLLLDGGLLDSHDLSEPCKAHRGIQQIATAPQGRFGVVNATFVLCKDGAVERPRP